MEVRSMEQSIQSDVYEAAYDLMDHFDAVADCIVKPEVVQRYVYTEQIQAQRQAAADAAAKAKSSSTAGASSSSASPSVAVASPVGTTTVSAETKEVMADVRAMYTDPVVDQFINRIREIFNRPYLMALDPSTNNERERAWLSAQEALQHLDDKVREEK